jgi:hypothetical protein
MNHSVGNTLRKNVLNVAGKGLCYAKMEKGIVKNVVGVLRTMSIKVNKEKLQKIYKEKK